MNQETLEVLLDRWMNEPQFREQIRQDPEAALAQNGIDLTEEDRQALNNIDWSLSDEELQNRVSKGG